MAPPAAPRLDPVKVVFVDIPTNITVDDSFRLDTITFHDFMASLSRLSASVANKPDSCSQRLETDKGFSLDDGCWWYRIVSKAKSRNGDILSPAQIQKGLWKILDTPFGYDTLVGEMSLGVKTQGGWIEIQHNIQKVRDQVKANEAVTKDADSQEDQSMTDDGPGPTVEEATYVGPVIVNGAGSNSAILHHNRPSPGLEKFPDVEMSDMNYPFDWYRYDMPQPPFLPQFYGHNQFQAPFPLSSQPAQYQPQYHNVSNIGYQQQIPKPIELNQHQNGRNSNNNYNNNRGRGQGRGRGGLPSFTSRPPPFPAQIGTPPPDAYAKWRLQHPKELDDKEEILDAEDDANYHTTFQTGSPKSGGRVRGKRHGRKGRGHQSPHAANGQAEYHHVGNQGLFGYGPEDFASRMPMMELAGRQYAHNEPRLTNPRFQPMPAGYPATSPFFRYDAQATNNNVPASWRTNPVLSNPVFPYNPYGNYPRRPTPQSGSNEPLPSNIEYVMNGVVVDPQMDLASDFDFHNYRDDFPHMNTNIMKESEINSVAAMGAATNLDSRVPGRLSTKSYTHNLPLPPQITSASIHPSPVLSNHHSHLYPQMELTHNRYGTFAATFDSAEAFNAKLSGCMNLEQAEPNHLGSRNIQSRGNATTVSRYGSDTEEINGKQKKSKNKGGRVKGHGAFPPVGAFSPPKPRGVREGKAKKLFEMQGKEDNPNDTSEPLREISSQRMSRYMSSAEGMASNGKGKGSVDFSAGAKRNRPRRDTIRNDIKFGFDDMKDAEQNEDSTSDLTELSRSISPTSTVALDSTDTPRGQALTPIGLAAKRLKTKMANRAKEARHREEMAKNLEVKVEMQNESRAERAKRRASGRVSIASEDVEMGGGDDVNENGN